MPTATRQSWYERLFGKLFGRSKPETTLDRVKRGQAHKRQRDDALRSLLRPSVDAPETPDPSMSATIPDLEIDPGWADEQEPEWEDDFTSSNVEAYCYWPKEGRLEVKFHDGSHYQYTPVTRYEFAGLQIASSKGRYLRTTIHEAHNRFYFEITGTKRKYRRYPEDYLGAQNTG